MRPRFLIIISILILVIFAVLFWHRPVKQEVPKPEAQVAVQPTNKSTIFTNTAGISLPAAHIPTASEIIAISNKAVENLKSQLPEIIEAHNVPVNFWGKVVDQDGKPLPGAHVVMRIRQAGYSPIVGTETLYPQKETQSDSNGRFEWTGNKGDRLSVDTLELTRYELEPNAQREFGASSGSIENPVIFKMWPTNLHEQLITGDKKFQIVPDGRPYFINLIDGTISESGDGDLKVWIKRPDQIGLGQSYDWSCELDAINGGILLESNPNASMFSAPTDGYEQSFHFEQITGSGWGDSTGTKRFYIILHNGQMYGRISIELYAYYNNQIPALIRLSYAVNPSGSHILR